MKYYSGTNLIFFKALSFYLFGYNNEILNNPDSALLYYKQASQILTGTPYYDLHGLTLYNLSYLNIQREHYVPARDYLHQAIAKFRASGNRKYLAYAWRDLAWINHLTGLKTAEVLKLHHRAMQLARQSGDTVNYEYMQAQEGEYLADSRPEEARVLILGYLKKHPQESRRFSVYLAQIYFGLHRTDSAAYYLHESGSRLQCPRDRMLHQLISFYVHKNRGNTAGALASLESAYALRDSIFSGNMNNHLYEVDRKFDLNAKEKENLELKINNRNKIIYIGVLIIGLMVLLIIFFIFRYKQKRLHMQKSYEQEKLRLSLDALHAINEKKKELLYNKLHVRTQNTLSLRKFEMGIRDSDKQKEFIEQAYRQLIINEEEWDEYFRELDHLLDEGLTRFNSEYPDLTRSDMRIIMLIVLKCDITDCSTLMQLSKNTLYHRRSLLRERLGLPAKDDNLDAWLMLKLTPGPAPA